MSENSVWIGNIGNFGVNPVLSLKTLKKKQLNAHTMSGPVFKVGVPIG
jgi:hypothetical protein